MKKLLTFILALVMLSLAACASVSQETQTNTEPPVEATVAPTAAPTEYPTPEPTATPEPWVVPIGLIDEVDTADKQDEFMKKRESMSESEFKQYLDQYDRTVSVAGEYYKNAFFLYALPDGFECRMGPHPMDDITIFASWDIHGYNPADYQNMYIRIMEYNKSCDFDTITGKKEKWLNIMKRLCASIENVSDEELYLLVGVTELQKGQPERTNINGCPAIIFTIVFEDGSLLVTCIIEGPDSVIHISLTGDGEKIPSDTFIQTMMDIFYSVRVLPKNES